MHPPVLYTASSPRSSCRGGAGAVGAGVVGAGVGVLLLVTVSVYCCW